MPVVSVFSRSVLHGDDGVYEKGYADAGFFKNADDIHQVVFVTDGIPAMVGRDLVQGIRHQGHLGRGRSQHEIDKFLLLAASFDIKLRNDDLLYVLDILVANMSFVRSGMNGDPIGPE